MSSTRILPGSAWANLPVWQRRALKTVGGLGALVAGSTLLYHTAMVTLEGQNPAYSHSMQVVVETYTGTGYGSDSPWSHPATNALVSLMDVSTFLLVFFVVPYVFRPVLQEALSPTVPTAVEKSGHIVVCGRPDQAERLIEEFETRGVDYVTVVESESEALDLQEAGRPVIHGDPTDSATLERARVDTAAAVVVDTDDDESAACVLAVGQVDEEVRTVVLVADLVHERQLRYAGADEVLTPRHVLARRLGERVASVVDPGRSDTVRLGENLALLELSVFDSDPLCGRSVDELQQDTGSAVTIVGIWDDGTFQGSPSGDTVVDGDDVVLLAGPPEKLEGIETRACAARNLESTVVVAGNGIVGSTVAADLRAAGLSPTVVDVEDGHGVDVVGDATEPETLRRAGIEDAAAFVVALSDDNLAILSILAAAEITADIDIVVRINRAGNDTSARRAGADYALGLPEVSGRVLAEEILHEDLLFSTRQLKIVRTDISQSVGLQIGDTDIANSACVVVAVERNGQMITDVRSDFELREHDRLVLVGSDDDVSALV